MSLTESVEHERLFFGVQCKITTKQINEDVWKKKSKEEKNETEVHALDQCHAIFFHWLVCVCVCA